MPIVKYKRIDWWQVIGNILIAICFHVLFGAISAIVDMV